MIIVLTRLAGQRDRWVAPRSPSGATRPAATAPARVIKRGLHNAYRAKRAKGTITRNNGPPEIRIYAPAPALNGIGARRDLYRRLRIIHVHSGIHLQSLRRR